MRKTIREFYNDVKEDCSASAVGAGAIGADTGSILGIGTTEKPTVKIVKKRVKTKTPDNSTV